MDNELFMYKGLGKVFGAALKMKRPFALKVSGMTDKIPSEALDTEKKVLYTFQNAAFVHQQLSETMKYYSRILERYYDELKKTRKGKKSAKKFDPIKFENSDGYENMCKTNNKDLIKNYTDNLKELKISETDKNALDSVKELIENYNSLNEKERSDNEKLDNFITKFKKMSVFCKSVALDERNKKMEVKDNFKAYLKQVKAGLKLEQIKKYGKLTYELDDSHNPISCKHNIHWLEESTKDKITKERAEIILRRVTQPYLP